MTGFRLWWHMKSENETQKVTRPVRKCGDWAPKAGVPKYIEHWLHEMSKFARQERLNNNTEDDIIKEAIQAKGNSSDTILNTDKCDGLGGQTRPEYYPEVFSRFEKSTADGQEGLLFTEDIRAGFLVFSALIYCPKSAKQTFQLYQFLNNLVKQSLRE